MDRGNDRLLQTPEVQLSVLDIFVIVNLDHPQKLSDAAVDGRIREASLSAGDRPHGVAGGKSPPGAAYHHAVNVGIVVAFLKGGVKLPLQVRGQGIEGIGLVQGDLQDPFPLLAKNQPIVVSHVLLLSLLRLEFQADLSCKILIGFSGKNKEKFSAGR
jgi:hypothetical protein